ncbi:Uncharacterized protein GBIM_10026 [Gryllus bimaculatus]|nr:Uncharacterized protein GBIM_10026 [Gryllus bimaculatus]
MGETNDIGSVIMDEIALEGLDGITIEGLFVRLKDRPEFATSLNDAFKQYIWEIICNFTEIDMFELPVPRKPLVVFNRYDYVDPELGMIQEPEILPEELYPHVPVDDKKKGIRGSCALYNERVSVYQMASQLSLEEAVERWGTKLVIVASQQMRNLALMGSSVDPELELTILQYCILERVGRSRHLGEVTQGRVSLQITGEDPKALFYHRKYLMKHGLIVKQIHHQKSGSQNCSGSLLHLPRFYVERWPKVLFLTKRVIEILRECKNYIADYDEIRKKLGLMNSLKKLFQTAYFQRFVRTDLKLPYRHLYPDAKESEWRSLNNMKEKMIRVIQLLDPNADVDIMSAREDEFDIDDEEHSEATSSRAEFNVTLNRSFLSQAYQVVEGAGVNGYSQMELVEKMGLPKLSARTVSRNLLKRGVASTFMNDVGRQRVSRFRARKWDQQCTRIQNIERDIEHMRAELLSKALGAGHEVPSTSLGNATIKSIINQKGRKRTADVSVDDLKLETEALPVKRTSDETSPQKDSITDKTAVVESAGTEVGEHNQSVATTVSAYSSRPLYCSVANFHSKEAMRKPLQHQTKDGPVMTYRIFKRINMILEYVKIHKVVDDHSKFLKLINEEEEREGLTVKIDKKSLLRLLIRLKEDGCLKLHSYLLTDGVKVKTMIFICDNNVALDHPAIISAIEQAKMKLFIVNRDSINLAVASSPIKGIQSQRALNKKQKVTFLYDKKIGRKYGFCPKFVRMRTLHQFLFYLVYGYEGNSDLDQNLVIPFLESKDVMVDDSLRSELTQVYFLDIHWKMFIPPLPAYSGGPKGWSIMCDILLRLPLSLFVRIFNVCYVVTDLNEYLQHPVRRHFLVRQLPVAMQNGLMAFRKYIFSIHEVLQRLCYIGLLQFGPQRLKEKDQVLIYVNQRTSLLDTVNSKPGYHQISEEEYPEIKYEFKSMQDVETYWYNLWNICINTQLGKDIVLEHLPFKPAMLEALQPVRPSRAPGRDTGEVPGDRRGAAGLDSAIFAHLKRNWNWANISTKIEELPKKVDRRKYRIMNLKAAPVVFNKSAIIVKRSINYLQKGRFTALRSERRTIPPAGAEVLLKKKPKTKPNVVRRIEARKSRVPHKPFYDEVDLKALHLMSKLRVEWSTEEDTLLLLCKVASMYLCPNPRQQTIALSSVRDILHSCIPEAQNKTSRACQRRVLYMLKNLATSNNLAMHLEELKQDEDICERFGRPEDNARGNHESAEEYERRIHEKFRLLVSELQGRSHRMVTASETYSSTIPDTAEDFWTLFDVVEPRTVIKRKGAFQDVKNVVDIHCSVVNTIIHSSLCSTPDKTSWAYQLFRVYQQYPDSLLRAAMAKLRQDQMVSLKKSYARYKQKGNYLPVSSSPYQLSVSYLQLIQTKYQYGVFHESYEMITLSVDIPDQVIILDPWISERDETYTRIVERYKDILQTCRTGRDSTTSALFRMSLGNVNDYDDLCEPVENLSDNYTEEMQDTSLEKNVHQKGNENYDDNDSKDFNVKNQSLQSNELPLNVKDCFIENKNAEKEDSINSPNKANIQITESLKITAHILKNTAITDEKKVESVESNSKLPLVVSGSVNKLENVSPFNTTEPTHEQDSSSLHYDALSDSAQEKTCDKTNDSSLENNSDPLNESNSTKNVSSCTPIPKPVCCEEEEFQKEMHTDRVILAQSEKVSEKLDTTHEIKGTTLNNSSDCVTQAATLKHSSNISDSLAPLVSENEAKSKAKEEENHTDKKNSGEAESTSKLEKNVNRKWSRLDFDWTPDKEWDIDFDVSERAGEEPDEADGADDDRIRGDYINMEGNSEEGDGAPHSNQQTLVARAATRIALFMMKEEMDDSNQVKNNQHAHDFFVVNSCSVFCHINKNKCVCTNDLAEPHCKQHDKCNSKIFPLTQKEIDEILNTIKSQAIVYLQEPAVEKCFECAPVDFQPILQEVIDFVESKKHLGVTLPQIQAFYEIRETGTVKLAEVLSLLVHHRVLIRAGVTILRYVHRRHVWPWLAHTFKFLRLEREKVVPSGSRIISCSEDNDNTSKNIENQDVGMDTEETSKEVSDKICEQEVTQNQLNTDTLISESYENLKNIHSQTENVSVTSNSDMITSVKESIEITENRNEKATDSSSADCQIKPTDSVTPDNVEKSDLDSAGKKGSNRKSKAAASHPLGTIGSKDMRKAAQVLAVNEKDEIHVLIRPWIRINGTLNRRVLDRLLGAVLGHAMYQPGQTLHSFGRRFQPALQPVHTRELIEILHKLGCIKLLVRKQKQKVTLFSKPEPVVLVEADGTEDDQEIIIEIEVDAISRLGQFIGEKSYSQDFMAAQEQMFSGRGPSEEKSRKRKIDSADDHTDSSTVEPDGCSEKKKMKM